VGFAEEALGCWGHGWYTTRIWVGDARLMYVGGGGVARDWNVGVAVAGRGERARGGFQGKAN
jgi:hypothetical protein